MARTLREEQRRVARELILRAAAEEIVELGLESLSLQRVTERAGVSKRTLYNYFESRQTLLAGIEAWSDELTLQMGGFLRPEGLDRLPEMVHVLWRVWEAQGVILQAVLRIVAASNRSGASEGRKGRRAALSDAVGETRPDLDAAQQDGLAVLFQALGSSSLYERLVSQDGLSVEAGSELVAWAVAVLRDALAQGNGPYEAG